MKNLVVLFLTLLTNYATSQQTVGVFYNTPEAFNGYTLIASVYSDTVYLIDNCGFQVNKWSTEGQPGAVTYLLENGDLLRTGRIPSSIYSGGGSGGKVQKFSWEGDLLWDFQASDSTIHQHHDVEPMPNGNILVLSWGYVSNTEAIDNGRNPENLIDELWPTVVQEIEPIYPDGGNVVWEWRLWDHLIQDFDSTKLNYGVVSGHPELFDINFRTNGNADHLHCNAVSYNEEQDLIALSSRFLGEIYVVDHSTTTSEAASHTGGVRGKGGDLLYRWGNPQVYDRGVEEDQILIGPHDIHWIPDSLSDGGKFMVFNNYGGSTGSAVYIFSPSVDINGDFIDPLDGNPYGPDTVDWIFEEPGFFSQTFSGAQRLPNGNTLVCEGAQGHIIELNPENEKVWEFVNASSISGNYTQGIDPTQNSLFRAYRYPIDFPAFIGWDLTPGGLIEIDPEPQPCSIYSDPTLSSFDQEVFDEVDIIVSQEQLRISVGSDDLRDLKARIYSAYGGLLCSLDLDNRMSFIDISNWASGLYLLEIRSGNRAQTFKFLR